MENQRKADAIVRCQCRKDITMNADQQRAAIAKRWPGVINRMSSFGMVVWGYYSNGTVIPCKSNDPLCDLNAVHEIEKTLTDEQYNKFRWTTKSIRNDDCIGLSCRCQSATAPQRWEALLRTVGELEGDK